jgi:hypothetical protein
MNTIFWGPSGWKFLHTLTFIYPELPSAAEKDKMREFMHIMPDILPCKYCRASFGKYCKSLPIDKHLASRAELIEWLYQMHNKVNKKLRAQGFCNYNNPSIEHVYSLYKPHQEAIMKIMLSSEVNTQEAINYICNLGGDFLGSIVFNYQGYYSNCHTMKEKGNIVDVYDKFFNSLVPLICTLLNKLCSDSKKCVARYNIPKFNIHDMLCHTEAYSKLIKWYYETDKLGTPRTSFPKMVDYEEHFKKNIANTCNSPTADKVKSCRKYFRVSKKENGKGKGNNKSNNKIRTKKRQRK